jgi:hypothetical protein
MAAGAVLVVQGKALTDPVIRRAFGQCRHCGGKGWHDRWGARLTGRRQR